MVRGLDPRFDYDFPRYGLIWPAGWQSPIFVLGVICLALAGCWFNDNLDFFDPPFLPFDILSSQPAIWHDFLSRWVLG